MTRTVADALYQCPHCGKSTVKVLDSRPMEGVAEPVIRRRRVCKSCAHRWATFEITDIAYVTICESLAIMQGVLPPYTRQRRTHNSFAKIASAIKEPKQ